VSAPTNSNSSFSKLSLPVPSVVAPPPSSVTREITSLSGSQLADYPKQIVPPPVNVGGQNGGRQGPSTLMASTEVVPPPPSVGGGTSDTGRGRGTKGFGLGGPQDVGSVLAPAAGGGGADNKSGVIVSSNPGSAKGVPGKGGNGSIAESPA